MLEDELAVWQKANVTAFLVMAPAAPMKPLSGLEPETPLSPLIAATTFQNLSAPEHPRRYRMMRKPAATACPVLPLARGVALNR